MSNISENKICQNCHKDFVIEPDDFSFYKKIKVPPPTFCPECRMIRRMAFRDYRIFYKRKSDKTGETIFSVFSQQSPFKVWERDIWWSDECDNLNHEIDVDFKKSFFSQLKELFLNVPLPSQTAWSLINSEYCAGSNSLKNCYLVFTATHSEDSMYCSEINNTKNSVDVTRIESSELCYQSFALTKCYGTVFSSSCENCMDVWFSRDLVGCNYCFGCTNLRNKQYYIFNEKYTKEEYKKLIDSFNLGSYKSIGEIKEKTDKIIGKSIRKFMEGHYNQNVSGEYINNSKNVHNSYYVIQAEDCKYLQCFITPTAKNCYDCSLWGENTELAYECSSIGSDNYNVKFSCRCYKGSQNCEYSLYCIGCSYVFGCSGLRSKQYCILNKQYSKEEYFPLVEKLKKHMNDMPYVNQKGIIYKYGEFFPEEFSSFCYNESLAQDYFPLKKEEALRQGYRWKDKEERNYSVDIFSKDIPDNINDVNEDIINKVIECDHNNKQHPTYCEASCTEAFKIIPEELQFYKRMNLPLPRLCPNCRYFERIKMRNPMKLWHRTCMCDKENHEHKGKCLNEFETSYAPEKQEIVYCERCYQQEVY
jgi:hypothetical protein